MPVAPLTIAPNMWAYAVIRPNGARRAEAAGMPCRRRGGTALRSARSCRRCSGGSPRSCRARCTADGKSVLATVSSSRPAPAANNQRLRPCHIPNIVLHQIWWTPRIGLRRWRHTRSLPPNLLPRSMLSQKIRGNRTRSFRFCSLSHQDNAEWCQWWTSRSCRLPQGSPLARWHRGTAPIFGLQPRCG